MEPMIKKIKNNSKKIKDKKKREAGQAEKTADGADGKNIKGK